MRAAGCGWPTNSLEYERSHARPGQRIVNTARTNGTLIDAEGARF
ncbi:hypothetical protein AB0N07_24955 [Streptomyces sp. NPDC051172]